METRTGAIRRAVVTGALVAAAGMWLLAGTAQAATMPAVDGLNLQDAESALEAAGLTCTYIEADGTAAAPFLSTNWTVVGAAYDAGAEVADGSSVRLVIEKNGREYDAAKAQEVVQQAKDGAVAAQDAAASNPSAQDAAAQEAAQVFSIEDYLDGLDLDALQALRDNVDERIQALQPAATEEAQPAEEAPAQEAVAAPADDGTPTLGSIVTFDGFTLAFGTELGTETLSNMFSSHDGQTVIDVPIAIRNDSDETKSLNLFYVTAFGSQGTQLDSVWAYFDSDILNLGDLRPGAAVQSVMHMLYDGNGDYYIRFDNWREEVEVRIPVAL